MADYHYGTYDVRLDCVNYAYQRSADAEDVSGPVWSDVLNRLMLIVFYKRLKNGGK